MLINRYALTSEYLKTILNYNADTGDFIWLKAIGGSASVGNIAGTTTPKGYRRIVIHKYGYEAQLLVYIYMTGSWPPYGYEIDHIKGMCNKWSNLRLATTAQNQHNSKIHIHNTTGVKGITDNKQYNSWLARISFNGKRYSKNFSKDKYSLEEVKDYISNLRNNLHGEFANHG
jgi:hypothetical protein